MKLDPVYLVAPVPRAKPSRRGFLAAAAGIGGLGFLGGWLLGRNLADESDPRAAEANPRIQWARNLANEHSGIELLEQLPAFLGVVHEAVQLGADDAILWSGVEKAARALVDSERPRAMLARAILTTCALKDVSPLSPDLEARLVRLTRR